MIRVTFLMILLFCSGCSFSLPFTKNPVHAEMRHKIAEIKSQQATAVKQVDRAQVAVGNAEKSLTDMNKDNWQENRAKAMLAIGEIKASLNQISDCLGTIETICEAHFVLIAQAESIDVAKDKTIAADQKQIAHLQDKWDTQIKDMMLLCAGLCLLGAIGLAILGAIMKKPALIVDGGICLLAFICCIAGIKYYEQMAACGGVLLLGAIVLAVYHIYQEFKTTHNALVATIATVDVVKSQIDPTKIDSIMSNQVAPLQAAAGATAKIAAVRSKLEGVSNGSTTAT